jgi:6-phosphogluconolactonase
MTVRDLRVLDTPADVARAGADHFVAAAARALAAHGRFVVVLAGGSIMRPMHEAVAARAGEIDWSRVDVWFGDERCVPPDDAESNYKQAHDSLLARVPIAPERVHRMRGELAPDDAARDYDAAVAGVRFDLTFLGMGPDGHTASLFPGTPALDERVARAVAVYAPQKPPPWRVTLSAPVLSSSLEVVVLVTSADKADAVARAFGPPGAVPIQLVQPPRIVWLIDRAAATKLVL